MFSPSYPSSHPEEPWPSHLSGGHLVCFGFLRHSLPIKCPPHQRQADSAQQGLCLPPALHHSGEECDYTHKHACTFRDLPDFICHKMDRKRSDSIAVCWLWNWGWGLKCLQNYDNGCNTVTSWWIWPYHHFNKTKKTSGKTKIGILTFDKIWYKKYFVLNNVVWKGWNGMLPGWYNGFSVTWLFF